MKTKRNTIVFILSLISLLLVTENILAQYPPIEIPDGYQSTPLSNPENLVDSFLTKSELSLNDNPNTENLTNSAQIVGGSTLINQAQADQIAGYLNEGNITLTNIFSKTSGDGKTAPNFHTAADGQGRTITVLRVQYNGQQYLIGGYNPQSWNSVNAYNITQIDAERTAFLFNLTSDFVQRQKLNSDPNCPGCGQYQTYNYSSYGPAFGGGHDLWVDNSLQNGYVYNWSYGVNTYTNNILNIGNPYTGYPNLQILGFEVFKVADCISYEFVGSYRTSDGPIWTSNPPTYTGQEAAALLYGGSSSDYAISINSSQDPSTITHTAWVDGWGSTLYFGATPAAENYKKSSLYNCGSSGCAYSAYVKDHINTSKINYVWRKVACQTNSAPNAVGDSYSTNEDTLLSVAAIGVLGNDTDAESNPLTATVVTEPANDSSFTLNPDGSFNYTPNPDYNGPDSFTYKANDGQADSNIVTVNITVNAVNDAPSLGNVPASATTDELVAYGFTASANDIDNAGQTLTFSLAGAPGGASIDPSTGVFTWTPSEAQGPGVYPFTVRLSDGELNTDAGITITVNEVNAAPTLSNVPASATIDELAPYSFMATAGDSDVPVQTLTFSLVGAPAGAIINPSTGEFSWTPTEAQGNGSANSFTVRVSDGLVYTDASISLTVNEVNSAPVLNAISNQTVDEETLLSVPTGASDSDVPANVLTYSLDAGFPTGMTIDSSSGAISWTPTEAQGAGDYPVTVRVTDNGTGNLSDTQTFNVHINEVNLAPVLNAVGNSTIDEQVAFGFTATATDADLPANNLVFSLVGAPAGASITSGGVFSWTPTEAQGPGSYTFTVKVTDDGSPNLSDEEQITITVNEVNLPPVLDSISNQTGYWGNAFSFDANATDPDLPANTLTFSLIGAPSGASINPSSGVFAWTPASAQIGSHTFTVRVTDNGTPNLSDEQSVAINVGKRPTALVYTGDYSEQYSDQQALSATLTDNGGGAMQGLAVSGKLVGFAIGTQNASDTTDASGMAAADLILTQNPNVNYTVDSNFAGDALYLPSSDSDAFDILQEDACAYYTGTLFVNTACATCSNGTATLSATVKDITAETSDSAYDVFAGDIRNATVTFVNRDTNTPIAGCSNLPVGLVNLADTKTGTATCNWNVNIGSGDSMDYTIGIIVNSYYTRNASADNSVLTVSKPIGTNFITGGGYLVNALSNGQYAGVTGLKTNFGFNVKYNKSGTNLQGRVNVIVRGANGRVYQIKGNVMRTLSVRTLTTNPLVRAAVYTGKANMTDITDPLNPIALGGNNSFQMELTDKGEPGNADTIGINVWNDGGGLLFSSRWDGTRTVEQILGGGNLVVR